MKNTTSRQQGFTITQMIITLAIISVISTFGVLGIRTARAQFKLQSSARLFATYVEKARLDAIRRHAEPGQESSIETFGETSTYAVTMDWGSGVVETRTFELDSGLNFSTIAKKVSFNWRGRIDEAWVFQIYSQYLEDALPVDVSGSGDITVGEQHFPDQSIPPVEISQVTGDVDLDPTPTPTPEPIPGPEDPNATPTPTPTPAEETDPGTGNGNGNPGGGNGNGNGNGNPTPSPTPTPTPVPSGEDGEDPPIPQCISTLSPSTLSLSQSDSTKQSGSATFTMTNATGVRTISATQAGNGNSLVVGISLVRIDGSGSSVITVTTKNGAGNRGVFVVNVAGSPSCGSAQQLTVSVSN